LKLPNLEEVVAIDIHTHARRALRHAW